MKRETRRRKCSLGARILTTSAICLLLPFCPTPTRAQPTPQEQELRRQLEIERAARKALTYQADMRKAAQLAEARIGRRSPLCSTSIGRLPAKPICGPGNGTSSTALPAKNSSSTGHGWCSRGRLRESVNSRGAAMASGWPPSAKTARPSSGT